MKENTPGKNSSSIYRSIPFIILLVVSMLAFSCYDSGNTANFGEACTDTSDCADGLVCIDGVCLNGDDGDSAEIDDADSDMLQCEEDWHCPIDYRCIDGFCVENVQCKSDEDCKAGQTCTNGVCTGDIIVDGDDDEDEIVDGDNSTTDGDLDQNCDNPCMNSSECSNGLVCNPDGCCGDPCTENSCPDYMVCNTENGYCEFCNETCDSDQCCNLMPGAFWYCGNCCEPPCGEGFACQYGECEALECPDCPVGSYCGPETKYLCYTPPVDGDTDDPWWPDGDWDGESGETGEISKSACFPANSSCIDGIDECCSGTCLMGTCL